MIHGLINLSFTNEYTVDSLYLEHPLSRTSLYLELKGTETLCIGCNLFFSLYLELSIYRTNFLVPCEFVIESVNCMFHPSTEINTVEIVFVKLLLIINNCLHQKKANAAKIDDYLFCVWCFQDSGKCTLKSIIPVFWSQKQFYHLLELFCITILVFSNYEKMFDLKHRFLFLIFIILHQIFWFFHSARVFIERHDKLFFLLQPKRRKWILLYWLTRDGFILLTWGNGFIGVPPPFNKFKIRISAYDMHLKLDR